MEYLNRLKKSAQENVNWATVGIVAGATAVGLYFLFRQHKRKFVVVLTQRVYLLDIQDHLGDFKLLKFLTPAKTNSMRLPYPLRGLFLPENAVYLERLRSKVDVLMLTEETLSTQTDIDQFFTHNSALRSNVLSISLRQLAGKGRGSHTWTSVGGNLFMTLGFSLDRQYPPLQITLAMAVVICSLVYRLVKCKPVAIKFPNDIIVDGQKVCGILTQSSQNLADSSLMNYKVGVGLNIRRNGDFPGLQEIVGLESTDGLRERLICEIVSYFFDMIGQKTPEQLAEHLTGYVNQNLQQKGLWINFSDVPAGIHQTLQIQGIRKEDFDLVGKSAEGKEFAIKTHADSLTGDPVAARLTEIKGSQ